MPVKLTTIPGPFLRPSPPKPLRWLIVLLGFIAAGILLMRFLGKLLGDTEFWWFAIGIPVVFWLVLMGFRLAIYLMQQIQANAWIHGVSRSYCRRFAGGGGVANSGGRMQHGA